MKILSAGPRYLPNTDNDGRRIYGGHYIWKDEVRLNTKLADRFMAWHSRGEPE
jgi:hypothetical protein